MQGIAGDLEVCAINVFCVCMCVCVCVCVRDE